MPIVYEYDERNPKKVIRVWWRKWYANGHDGQGYLSRDEEQLLAEGAEAQKMHDDRMREELAASGVTEKK